MHGLTIATMTAAIV